MSKSANLALASRLSNHFIRRLRHAHWADVCASAVEQGILRARSFDHLGLQCFRFHPSSTVANMSMDEIIARISKPVEFGIGRRHRFIYKHGEIVVDESFTAAKIKYSGAREISVSGDLEPDFEAGATHDPRKAKVGRSEELRLFRLFRRGVCRPSAGDVATVLLLAKGVEELELSVRQIGQILNKRRVIVALTSPIEGFEDRILDLLQRGLILPGESMISMAGNLTPAAELRAAVRRGAQRHIAAMPASRVSESPYRVSLASEGMLPILCVSEELGGIPASMAAAANMTIRCPSLTPEVVENTIQIVTGTKLRRGVSFDCSSITLDDLDLAVGPGNTAGEATSYLRNLVESRPRARRSGRMEPTTLKSGSELVHPVSEKNARLTLETMNGYPASVVEWWRDLSVDFQHWRENKLPWAEVGCTLLLSGPPGTGKTIFAGALSNTLQIPLIRTSVATWLQGGHLNTVVRKIADCFDEARANAPAVLFIDEVDGIGSRDDTKKDYSDYWVTVVNKLLEALNGLSHLEGLVVVGATNRPEAIDPALTRPGRLHPHLAIPSPDTAALAGIFRYHLGSDLRRVVEGAPTAAPGV